MTRIVARAPLLAAGGVRVLRTVGVGCYVGSAAIGIAAALLLECRVANARSASASLPVTVTVQNTCAASAESTAFGTYTAGGGSAPGSAKVTVKCSSGLGFKLAVGTAGVTPSGVASREGLATSFTVLPEVLDTAVSGLTTQGLYSDVITITITY